jgi:polar amino acid transport system substrate-binding protein
MKSLRLFRLPIVLTLSAIASTPAGAADDAVLRQLAPTGSIRVGVAYAPSATPLFVVRDADGSVRGVPRDIGMALGKSLGVPVEIVARATTNELTADLKAGAIDVGFMPMDDERRKVVDFSTPYFSIECTYLVAATSGIKSMEQVDRAEITVVGIDGSTTMRAARRKLLHAQVVTAKSVDEAMAMMRSGQVQAFALTHDSLPALQAQLPGSRILDGAFQVNGVAIAVQKDHPAALAYVTAFMNRAKSDGVVRKALDDAGFGQIAIAP